jgi:hypothetical protein
MGRSSLVGLGVLILAQLIGLALLYYGIRLVLQARLSLSWPTAPGEVIASHIRSDIDDDHYEHFYVTVRYNYRVSSQNYSGDSIPPGIQTYSDKEEAQEVTARYPDGISFEVFYSPENPGNSLLEPGTQRGGLTLIIGCALCSGLSVLFLWLIYFRSARR